MGFKSFVFVTSLLAGFSASAVWKGAETSAYPSTVQIRVASTNCSAVVLGQNWILTAGHCVEGGTKSKVIKIGFGNSGLKSFKVHRIYPHPGYKDGFFDNPNPAFSRYDLALIHLANAVEAPAVAVLATKSEVKKALLAAQGKALAVAYGKSSFSGTKKRIAVLPASLSSADYIETNSNNLGQGTCEGDSGSGLYVDTPQGPKVVGINSVLGRLKGSKEKGQLCGGQDSIGIIATLYAEADWIQNTSGIRF